MAERDGRGDQALVSAGIDVSAVLLFVVGGVLLVGLARALRTRDRKRPEGV